MIGFVRWHDAALEVRREHNTLVIENPKDGAVIRKRYARCGRMPVNIALEISRRESYEQPSMSYFRKGLAATSPSADAGYAHGRAETCGHIEASYASTRLALRDCSVVHQ